MSLNEIKQQTQQIVEEVLELSNLQKGQIFVLGLSSSEVIGGHIGKNSSLEVGEVIVETILDILEPKGMYLAVQGCEHLNRALVVERELAIQKDLEIVNVLPSLHAGGSGQLAAFKYMKDPVEVEFITAQAGVDIGDTAIGMHIKHVQVPVRPILREIDQWQVVFLPQNHLVDSEHSVNQCVPFQARECFVQTQLDYR